MRRLGIIFHSAHGHTKHFASHVAIGARTVPNVSVHPIGVEEISVQQLTQFDGLIWGSPTYLGGVTGPFKSFMDATGPLWRAQSLKGKLAAGFTVSNLPSGDKLSTLISMVVFSMQHGMVWVGNPILPGTLQGDPPDQAANRLGSWTGAVGQAAHGTPPEKAFVRGDLLGAELFGQNFAQTLVQNHSQAEAA